LACIARQGVYLNLMKQVVHKLLPVQPLLLLHEVLP
jgi:hypothetical protein